MGQLKQNLTLIIVCVSVIVIVATAHVYNIIKQKEAFTNTNKTVDIVISRYAESLQWLCNDFFQDIFVSKNNVTINIIIYNKGEDFTLPNCIPQHINVTVHKLDNVGRCDHTYMYHIVDNYNRLADVTIFLPGSCDMENKLWRTEHIVKLAMQNINTVMICDDYNDIKKEFKDFYLDNYLSTNGVNASKNQDVSMQHAEPRPFGKWFEHVFGKDANHKCVNWFGILAVSKNDVHKRSIDFYKMFVSMLDKHNNPEVGHYIERSWFAIFQPKNFS